MKKLILIAALFLVFAVKSYGQWGEGVSAYATVADGSPVINGKSSQSVQLYVSTNFEVQSSYDAYVPENPQSGTWAMVHITCDWFNNNNIYGDQPVIWESFTTAGMHSDYITSSGSATQWIRFSYLVVAGACNTTTGTIPWARAGLAISWQY